MVTNVGWSGHTACRRDRAVASRPAATEVASILFAGNAPGRQPDLPRGPGDRPGHEDTATADTAVVEALLRCWVRETGLRLPLRLPPPPGTATAAGAIAATSTGDLVLPVLLASSAARLDVLVRYWSPCGWHRFGAPRLAWVGVPPVGVESAGMGTNSIDVGTSGSASGDESGTGNEGLASAHVAPGSHVGVDVAAGVGVDVDVGVGVGGAEVDAGLLAALLVREAAGILGMPAHATADALGRIIDSARRIAIHAHHRRTRRGSRASAIPAAAPRTDPAADDHRTQTDGWLRGNEDLPGRDDGTRDEPPFLTAERSLVAGHPFHPAAKSRDGAGPAELAAYSPELDGAFPIHWFAAHPSVVTIRGRAPAGAVAGNPAAASTASSPNSMDITGTTGMTGTAGTDAAGVAAVLRSLAGSVAIPAGYVAVPAHPWQAREACARPAVAALLASGMLVDVGPAGPDWYPTASLRTVWRPDAPVMFKLSLGMRVTNSRRENTRRELDLGVRVARLVEAGLGDWLATHHPAFRLIPDPAWVGVDAGSGENGNGNADGAGSGLDTAIRANPIGVRDRVVCVAALVADSLGTPGDRLPPSASLPSLPSLSRRRGDEDDETTGETTGETTMVTTRDVELDGPGRDGIAPAASPRQGHASRPTSPRQSSARQTSVRQSSARQTSARRGSPAAPPPLAGIVTALAHAQACSAGDAAIAWFGRYLDVVAAPVFGMYLDRGVGVEAHHQNTLVTLDDDGWPVAGWYRDSQGYYVAASRAAEAEAAVPGFGQGVDAVFDDTLVEERIIYYTVVNNIFGVVGALGASGVADETRLLGVFRSLLARLAADRRAAGKPPARLLATLLEAPTLPCKGNLLTCVDGRDEVTGPVETQSVYVEIPNPLVAAHP